MPKLVITDGEGTREVGLNSGDTLGRTSQNAIQLKTAEASRQHCRFTLEKKSWFVEDLGSSNGTLVNGRRVTKFELQDGDVIAIGKVECKFLESEPESVPSPAQAAASWGDDDISLEEKVFLVLGGAGRRGEIVQLPEGRLSVGRNAKHALVLKDASVSGDHAEVRREAGGATVKDLGSSNGTFVNGRRVEEASIVSGDILRFGSIECVYGVGDPKEFPAPGADETASASSDEFTRAMPVAGLGDDASFELHEAAPPRRETVWNLLALVLILGLGGGAAWLLLRPPQGQGGPAPASGESQGTNLLPAWAWSFEVPDLGPGETEAPAVPVWAKADPDDPAEMGEVSEPVHSGSTAWRIASAGPKPALAVLEAPVVVSPGTAYRISAKVTGDGGNPVLAAVWMDRPDEAEAPVEITRDPIHGLPSGRGWTEISGLVFAPEGASLLKVGVGAAGRGDVIFDDVVAHPVDVPPGRVRDAKDFKATLEEHGTLRVSRYGRRLVEGLGVATEEAGRWILQEALLAPEGSAGDGVISGSLAGGRGALRVALTSGAETFTLDLSGPGLASAGTVAIPIVPREGGDVQVTLLDGEAGKSHSQDFAETPGTALIVGAGPDRAKIHLQDAGGQPVRIGVRAVFAGGGATVYVGSAGREALRLEFQLSFAREEAEARSLLAGAGQAARDQRGGEALKACDDLMSRFPFEPKIVEDAARIHAEVSGRARGTADALRRRLDDAIFFRDLRRNTGLAGEIAAERARYSGTTAEAAFSALEEECRKALDAWAGPLREAEAARILARGRDYLDGGKRPLARLFFGAVLAAFAGTEEAGQAEAFLNRMGAEGAGGGR